MALDNCEPQIIRALEKDGWTIRDKPFGIRVRAGEAVVADFSVERLDDEQFTQLIILEVKCFANPNADLHDFYVAIGQYLYYQNALMLAKIQEALYLAIPHAAYERLIKRQIVAATLQSSGVKLLVVDIELEEIVGWIG